MSAIEKRRKLHEARTPGPVSIERRDGSDGAIDYIVYANDGDVCACYEMANDNCRANATAIESALNDHAALLDIAEAAREMWRDIGGPPGCVAAPPCGACLGCALAKLEATQ